VNVDENRNVETLRRFYDTVNEGGIAAALPLVVHRSRQEAMAAAMELADA
jgi:hypothetical protein